MREEDRREWTRRQRAYWERVVRPMMAATARGRPPARPLLERTPIGRYRKRRSDWALWCEKEDRRKWRELCERRRREAGETASPRRRKG